ncbi:tRNA-specific adenosine deaminase [Streptococcus gallolyticus subsp. gallolyticus]|uniref:nucleoside deaminase n=1 Tax=Streptococcus TaxID=1301 RepID=UPI000201B4B5|nr:MULTISPECIES: nucleoside deaminase [Streptococcus]MCO7177697.1 nucleoside deaminase [Streptococcus gallolyticus]MCR5051306.1 nucleoside deaminase [Streptococcus sp.]MCY7165379.1 nucleoside deaminase [Streptococcus gallolyticus subsp. gallolyticus]MCY7178840.1 nucleoside deaminase [Streptococcus gallolyticus subsp. gallolyticus]MCY7182478.1 nucleoside deaminase [Streptococcus gallolyticus subsp. gallolyticus]
MLEDYMQKAIQEAYDGIKKGDGGPFGSVIVKDGEIIASGHNMVLAHHDPTAHGEVTAIRKAGEKLGTHDLSGTTLFTTGEPCPMCLAACLWANIDKIYYGCTIADNAMIGFRDQRFDELMGGRKNLPKDYLVQLNHDDCLKLFKDYQEMTHNLY